DLAMPGVCDAEEPPTVDMGGGHEVACHLYAEGASPDWQVLEAGSPAGDPRDVAGPPTRPAAPAGPAGAGEPLLEVIDLKTHFPITKGFFNRVVGRVKAVDGVTLTVYKGETLAVVGESGSGKTTLAHSIMRLHDPTSGTVA